MLHTLGLTANSLLNKKILREYVETDIIIDLSGDSFSDSMGERSIKNAASYLLGISLRKPLVLYSQSIGPFSTLTLPLAKYCLNRADLIIVREHITNNYLKSIGIHKPQIYVAAETAFLLEPASCERVREILSKEGVSNHNEPLIGISVSQLINRSFEKREFNSNNRYVVLMAQVIDYLTKKFNAQILFIPHVVVPAEWGYDDRFAAEKIYKLVGEKCGVRLIKSEYTPQELKGIIGQCDLFIGARMHSNIAAISMNVPTIAIAWSHKYWGIMRMFELEGYVCNCKTMNFDELTSKINDVWSNREQIKENLKYKVEAAKESALLSGRLIKSLLDSLRSDSFQTVLKVTHSFQ